MNVLSEKVSKIDLLAVMKSEGIELRQAGNNWKFLCPFHDDTRPSGSLRNNGKWRWFCFGCGEKGDAIDFVRKLHGLDFLGACQFLGIESGPLSPKQKKRINRNKQRRKITDAFKKWRLCAIDDLRRCINLAYSFSRQWESIEQFETGAMILDPLAELEWIRDILMTGNEADQIDVFKRWLANGNRF